MGSLAKYFFFHAAAFATASKVAENLNDGYHKQYFAEKSVWCIAEGLRYLAETCQEFTPPPLSTLD